MNIIISNSDGLPIYEQIYRAVKGSVLSGELTADDALPSIRSLAKDLRISVITTKRAYEELERDGIIYSVVGKGFYVARCDVGRLTEMGEREIEELLRQVTDIAHKTGISQKRLRELAERSLYL